MSIFIYPQQQVTIPGAATEATLLLVEQNTADTVTELQTANATLNGVATEATQLQVETNTASTVTELQAANASLDSLETLVLTDTQLRASAVPVSVASLPLPAGAATEATLAAAAADIAALNVRTAGSLVPEAFDEQVITYVLAGNGIGEISTVVYKLATVTVATLTMSYDANDKLSGVVRS
jgi:hypothetical protein